MLFDKIGLTGNRSDIDPEISISDFKTYEYSESDYRRIYKPYDVMRVQINIPFKILNGILTIKDDEYNIGDKTLKDVYDIFNKYGAASFFTDFEKLSKLPAVLLSNCSNTFTTTIDGYISPLPLETDNSNQTITELDSITTNLVVYDTKIKKGKAFTKKGNNLYFTPSKTTKVYLTTLTKDLYLRIDFGPRRLISEKDVSYLLNFKRG